jgi:RimJ/RimL family protein N-acetyltransferase
MEQISLAKIIDDDIILIEQWLQKEYIKKWYDPIDEWINEIKNRNGKYDFIRHFMVEINSTKIGFCQYYDCFDAQESWYKINKQKYTYSIDYLIGEENYLHKGYGKEIIQQLIEKVKTEGGKEIIVQPDMENTASNKILLATGFEYLKNKEYYYKKI